jgi:4-nitrophenyl phosphatase
VAAQFLRRRFGSVRFWYIGEEGILEEMRAAGHTLVSAEEAEWIVVGMDRSLTYEKLAQALRALLRGARLLATNEDPTFPTPEGLVPGAGAVVGALRGMGFPPEIVVGKPSPISFQVALEVLGLGPSEVLMIGDRLDTDIAGAQALGMDTALVLSGVTKPEDLTEARIRPTYVAWDLLELVAGAKES